MIATDRDSTGHDSDNSNDEIDTGSDTDSDTDDATSVDNAALWLCHKPSDDPDHCDDPDGAGSNLMHRPCPDCVRRTHRQVRLMQRWATMTKTTLPSPLRTPNSKGKGKMPQATTSWTDPSSAT